jgi:hypothetical protein
MIYEGFRLSSKLKPGLIEIVVESFESGKRNRLYEALVPGSRISAQRQAELLKVLVCRFAGRSGLGFEQIVSAFLNTRGKRPPASNPFQMHVSYPEPGVKRTYCGTDTLAWADEVILPNKFRTGEI